MGDRPGDAALVRRQPANTSVPDGYRGDVLAFVTSLPHPANCASYRARSLLLLDTLASVLGQRNPDIRVVIVANAPPECELPDDERIEVARVSFPPSSSPPGHPSLVGIEIDKGAKLGMGTAVAARSGAEYVMWVDSDDFIHRDIATFVAAEAGPPGWFSDMGYFHVRGDRVVTAVDHEFHQRNGSTHIIRTDLLGIPADLSFDLTRDEVIERIGHERATQTMGRHRPVVEFFERQGTPLIPLPFPAAIWEIGTGENCTGLLAAAGRKEPVRGRIAEDFGLPIPTRLTAVASRAATIQARITRRVKSEK